MPTYKTPDVYVEEISVFPPSVAEVETAIPAFIGYTEKAKKTAHDDLILKPTKIYSLKEYEQYYGYPKDDDITLTVVNDSGGGLKISSFTEPTVSYLMYFSLKMFFDNGGGQCYIVSVGTYETTPAIDGEELGKGLDVLALEDEPTLIVIPESVKLLNTEYLALVQAVLSQCNKLGDRFAIFDLYNGDQDLNTIDTTFSDGTKTYLVSNRVYFGNNYLKYGAAYYPFLKTTLNYYVNNSETNVKVTLPRDLVVTATARSEVSEGVVTGIVELEGGSGYDDSNPPSVTFEDPPTGERATAEAEVSEGVVTGIVGLEGGSGYDDSNPPSVTFEAPPTGETATAEAEVSGGVVTGIAELEGGSGYDNSNPPSVTFEAPSFVANLNTLKTRNTALYNFVKNELKKHYLILPPSAAVAGVYAATDSNRGVWKAPANVSLANVIEPVIKLDNTKQDDLNVDATTGKSINAIRAFMGKGTLVWGARTLAGNDNEWRYIPVRRFFNMVEESVKKSTYWAVFEPNDANTWVKIRGMIESYLTQQWRNGALAGATPQEAFFVRCGLGITMDPQDILEGRMNVEIGMAVVRPAEFIILKFSHKLQTA